MKKSLMRGMGMVALIAATGFASVANQQKNAASPIELCQGFVPENNLRIPIGMYTAGGITEAEFNSVLDRIEKIFKGDIEREGDTLKINRLWSNSTVNASAQRSGKTVILNMYGGLARHAATTIEGFALVACHEMGHHRAGAPKNGGFGGAWATNEGGSDYYATLKCLRWFFAEDDNEAITKNASLDAIADNACSYQWPNEQDRLICLRSSMAGQSVANLFQALRTETTMPNFGTPDKNQVTRMVNEHPETQCRLDTYFAGMVCLANTNDKLSNTDYKEGSCYAPRDTIGNRPRCWFYSAN